MLNRSLLTVAVGAVFAIIMLAPGSVNAQSTISLLGPDKLASKCITDRDSDPTTHRTDIAIFRAECDEVASNKNYRSGFVKPSRLLETCMEEDATVFLCCGVPNQGFGGCVEGPE